ncbi:MAG: pseudouridine synthase [Dokdonella sp.]|uniref:pseudouridine synthase n=1 Tax=Dokdonella sp. TaxID=2291710 RepID=UPI003264B08C
MTEPLTLTRRVAQLCACSYAEAEQVIADGGASINGAVVTDAQRIVDTDTVEVAAAAHPDAIEPATVLVHKPAGMTMVQAAALVVPETRMVDDPSGVTMRKRHYVNLTPLMPLDDDASGLIVLSQDGRVWRRLSEDADEIEQEFIVDVDSRGGPYTLGQLARGLSFNGRELPACKVSWQSELRLRFAMHNVQRGQLRHMCGAVGIALVSMRRLRIGSVSLAKMPVGTWRPLKAGTKF